MSRVEQSVKNFKVSSFALGISIILNFISRSVFIKNLGTDVVGLSSTLLNILGFLNLAELGLTSAIAGTLYAPLYNKDKEEIKDIISIFGFLYRIIGFTILSIGVIVSFFLPYFFSNTGLPNSYIFAGYYIFLCANLVGYFISYKQTLLVADQREYIVTSYTYGAQVLKFVSQIVVLKYFEYGYIAWLGVELFWGVIYGFAINRIVNKKYPWLITSYKRGKEVYRNYRQLFVTIKQVIPHNIGAFVLNQTSNILIYAFSSLTYVTIYTNYTMILVRCVNVLNICLRGVTASIGNLIAEGEKNKIISVFYQFNVFFCLIGGTVCITCYYQTESFINLWLGAGFLLDKWIFVCMLYVMYVGIIRLPVNYYIGGFVLYKDVWAPIAEAVINLTVAITLGSVFGIGGVVLGTVVSLTLIIVLWKPFFLFKHGFRLSVLDYWRKMVIYLLILVPVSVIPYFLFQYNFMLDNNNVTGFLLNTIFIFVLVFSMYAFLLWILDKNLQMILKRMFTIVFNR